MQEEVYRATTKGLIEGLISGYNATVFAYGPTGLCAWLSEFVCVLRRTHKDNKALCLNGDVSSTNYTCEAFWCIIFWSASFWVSFLRKKGCDIFFTFVLVFSFSAGLIRKWVMLYRPRFQWVETDCQRLVEHYFSIKLPICLTDFLCLLSVHLSQRFTALCLLSSGKYTPGF